MEQAFVDYLTTLNIPVSRKYFRKRLASHPDYPSLLSVSDTLEYLGIPHGVARMDRASMANLELPYVLHLENDAGEYIVIKEENDVKQRTDIPKDWNGVVLKAEPVDEVKDAVNRRFLSAEKAKRWGMYLFVASLSGMVTLLLWNSFVWPVLILLATAIAGNLLGYLLVAKDLGVKYDVVESFCNAGKSTNCDRVMRSDEATLFGQFSFSDAVLSYFAVQLITVGLLIPLAVNAAPLWWILSAAGVLTLPIVAYSFWLQAIRFKTWCRLCLLVAGVLVVQSGLFWWMATAGMFGLVDGVPWTIGLVVGLFLASASLVFLLKTRLKEGIEAEKAEVAANRIKFNPSVFAHLLLQRPQADCTPFEQELLIGNPNAPIQITMATSLGCGPCREGLEKVKQLVSSFPDLINLSIRLSVSNNGNGQESDPGWYLLEYWMKQVYNTNDQSKQTEKLLQEWFEMADMNAFREKYSLLINGQSKGLETMAMQHSNWFEKTEIKGTPTFFVNGYQLPAQYRIEDLRYLVAGFSEQISVVEKHVKQAAPK
tara:strand:+ start:7364 stop:8983 length:1620 start_codon:yes stop_codon:yes gene_type:complete